MIYLLITVGMPATPPLNFSPPRSNQVNSKASSWVSS